MNHLKLTTKTNIFSLFFKRFFALKRLVSEFSISNLKTN